MMRSLLEQLRTGAYPTGDLRWRVTDIHIRAADEIESLAAERDLLTKALKAAEDHLEFIGYGDKYERECAIADGLPILIAEALKSA